MNLIPHPKEHRLRAFENRVMRRLFERKFSSQKKSVSVIIGEDEIDGKNFGRKLEGKRQIRQVGCRCESTIKIEV
jgi:hypothetical protein